MMAVYCFIKAGKAGETPAVRNVAGASRFGRTASHPELSSTEMDNVEHTETPSGDLHRLAFMRAGRPRSH